MKEPQPWLGMAVNIGALVGFLVVVVGIFLDDGGHGPTIVVGFLIMAPAIALPGSPGWRNYWEKYEQRMREYEKANYPSTVSTVDDRRSKPRRQ